MLVLSMGKEERIIIEHNNEILELCLCKIKPFQISIGFEGSHSFDIIREKVVKKNASRTT